MYECLDGITDTFHQQIQALIETVKQMDSALQRRSKLRSTNAAPTVASAMGAAGSNSMTDYDKIALQIQLDVNAFGDELRSFGVELSDSKAFKVLLEEVSSIVSTSSITK